MRRTGYVILILVCWFFISGCTLGDRLSIAAYHGNINEVKKLVEQENAPVNADMFWEPLSSAVLNGHEDVVDYLIEKGADIDIAIRGLKHVAKNGFQSDRIAAVDTIKKLEKLKERLKDEREAKAKLEADRKIAAGPTEDPAEVAAFEAEAKKYRAMSVKPELPEEARKYWVQAKAATQDKMFDNAAALYAKALKVAPWWPDGHFNRAVILGEINRYGEAMREMKRYLVLEPDAKDARAAQDKIYEWEGRVQQYK